MLDGSPLDRDDCGGDHVDRLALERLVDERVLDPDLQPQWLLILGAGTSRRTRGWVPLMAGTLWHHEFGLTVGQDPGRLPAG